MIATFIADDLNKLLSFIDGSWLGPFFGKGIHTYPNADTNTHAGCLELERAGKITRVIDEPEHVFWMPADSATPSENKQ